MPIFTNCPDEVSICPEYHSQPLFFTQPSHTPFGDKYVNKTPSCPPQNTPFSGLILKVDKTNYSMGKMDPKWAKCLKSGQNFLIRIKIIRALVTVGSVSAATSSRALRRKCPGLSRPADFDLLLLPRQPRPGARARGSRGARCGPRFAGQWPSVPLAALRVV